MTAAQTKEGATWNQLVAGWEAKLAGESSDAEARFQAARDLAEARGFRYLKSDQVAKLPLNELLERFKAIPGFKDDPEKPDMLEAAALLGGAQQPPLVSRLIDIHSQKRTVAASATAERNTFGHLS
jgi:hypothetical protein